MASVLSSLYPFLVRLVGLSLPVTCFRYLFDAAVSFPSANLCRDDEMMTRFSVEVTFSQLSWLTSEVPNLTSVR